MNLSGLTDSPATMIASPNECPRCHAVSRVANDLCLRCLLRTGTEPGENLAPNELESALDAVAVPDTQWRLGNYEILEEIGRGGMGVIYRARQRHSRRIVALKRLLSYHADSQDTLVRFRREAEAAASLDHPNILPIYEVGESEEGVPYFSMKFAPGGSLQAVGPALRGQPREIVRLMAKVARGVGYAHHQGILHRDLKPGNILLDGQGEPLVSDFGLAKWLDTSSDLTRTLTVYGTPGYIAPEQAEGPSAELTPVADIYSLGAILFDLLANRPPFLGDHVLSVIRQASDRPAPKLRSLVRWADRDLETICARCLERDPTARYASADALAEDLERWLGNRPIIARPVSLPARLWRWSRRNPPLAVAALVCLALATAAAVWQAHGRRLETRLRETDLAARSVTVLPFLDLDTARADESTALAVASGLQNALSAFGPVRISAKSNGGSRWPGTGNLDDIKEANRDLKSRAVLTGSTRKVNGKLRLSIRVMKAATGEILFTRRFETSAGPGAVPNLVASTAPSLRALLDAEDWSSIAPAAHDPGLKNPAARNLIISGRQLMFRDTIEDYDRSISCLKKAIELEPDSALAHAYLSSTQASRAHFIPDPQLLKSAEKEAQAALRLQSDSPEAHRTLAGVLYLRGRLKEALEEQLRAIEVGGPEEQVAGFRGMTLLHFGRPDRALEWLEMASHWAASPGSYDSAIGDCWTLLVADKRAEAAYAQAMSLRPERSDGWVGLCHLRLVQGDPKNARELYEQDNPHAVVGDLPSNDNHPREILAQIEFFARHYDPAEMLYSQLAQEQPGGGVASYGAVSYSSALGRLRQLRGDSAGAESILQMDLTSELEAAPGSGNPADSYILAALESSLGHVDAALAHLKTAISLGWIDYRSLRLDPRFDAISGEPSFHDMVATLESKVSELRRKINRPTFVDTRGETTLKKGK